MNIADTLKEAQGLLLAAGVESPRLEAALLLEAAWGRPRLSFFSQPEERVPDRVLADFQQMLRRRQAREPLQYILGHTSFMGHTFLCREGVLIPRNDSEAVCEQAIKRVEPRHQVLDLCCGTGCLGISIKLACPDSAVTLSDISKLATSLAQENAARLGAQVDIEEGDFFAPLIGRRYDLIICNPPYIEEDLLPGLQKEVAFEPALALSGGEDGLQYYRRLAQEAADYLNPGGHLVLEMGDDQAEAVSALFDERFAPAVVFLDLSGRPRGMVTRLL